MDDKKYSFGIVVIGYNNERGIERLLESISKVDYQGDFGIKLIISIDYSGNDTVKNIAEQFEWEHGEKIIVAHEKNLGLKKHILACGNYLNEYDLDAVAVLEDDIYVAPSMYNYMKNTVEFYENDPTVAGISLYKHELDILAKKRFEDYVDDSDVFFIQYAMSWGQIWLRDKWNSFMDWYENENWKEMKNKEIPANIKAWTNSWLKFHIMYCIDRNLYFVYPRVSQATNFSDAGVHRSNVSNAMQVKMAMECKKNWNFTRIEDSMAVYDAFFENIIVKKYLKLDNVTINLNGYKRNYASKYVLSTAILPYKVVKSWGLSFRPIETNIFLNNSGNDIFLYDTECSDKLNKSNDHLMRIFDYDLKGLDIRKKENLKYVINSIYNSICYRFKDIKKKLKKWLYRREA